VTVASPNWAVAQGRVGVPVASARLVPPDRVPLCAEHHRTHGTRKFQDRWGPTVPGCWWRTQGSAATPAALPLDCSVWGLAVCRKPLRGARIRPGRALLLQSSNGPLGVAHVACPCHSHAEGAELPGRASRVAGEHLGARAVRWHSGWGGSRQAPRCIVTGSKDGVTWSRKCREGAMRGRIGKIAARERSALGTRAHTRQCAAAFDRRKGARRGSAGAGR
jgi:hypothetical protein